MTSGRAPSGPAAAVAAKAPDPPARGSQQTNAVHNTGTIAIGALEGRDGNYRQGKYDALIPGGLYSGFPYTGGIYIGPGYCVRIRGWLPDGHLSDVWIIRGENWYELPLDYYGYDIRARPLSSLDC